MAEATNEVVVVSHDVGHRHPLDEGVKGGKNRLTNLAVAVANIFGCCRQICLVMPLEQCEQEAEDGVHLGDESLVDFFPALVLFQSLEDCNIFDYAQHDEHDQLGLRVALAAEDLQLREQVWPLLRPFSFDDFDNNSGYSVLYMNSFADEVRNSRLHQPHGVFLHVKFLIGRHLVPAEFDGVLEKLEAEMPDHDVIF